MRFMFGVIVPFFTVPATTVPTPGTLNVSSIRNSANAPYDTNTIQYNTIRYVRQELFTYDTIRQKAVHLLTMCALLLVLEH